MNETMPADLASAISSEPMWLQHWISVLVVVNMAAILFIVRKNSEGKLRPRIEAFAILASMMAAGIFMSWLYEQVGYVRLLGLAHIVFWLPVFVWLAVKFRRGEFSGPFKYYLILYFVIDGASLAIDTADVVRYLAGDRQALHLRHQ